MSAAEFLDELASSPSFAALLFAASIFVAVKGGRIAAHRLLATRLARLEGPPAVAVGLVLAAVGLAGMVFALVRGLARS